MLCRDRGHIGSQAKELKNISEDTQVTETMKVTEVLLVLDTAQ